MMQVGQTPQSRAIYHIKVSGDLDPKWEDWFGGFTIVPQTDNTTIMTGTVKDQAALHGIIAKIRDLGLSLISVNRIDSEKD